MRTFTTSIDIAAPPSRVYEVMSDVERWPEWTRSVSSVKLLGGKPFGAGVKVLVRQPKLPPAVWTVSDVQPNRSFTWIAGGPGMQVKAQHSVEPTGSGSRVTLYLEYRGFIGLFFARITERITETYMNYEAQGLKSRSENPAFSYLNQQRQG